MTTEAELREEFDRVERRQNAVYTALPYYLLAVSTIIAVLSATTGVPMNLPAVLALTLTTTLLLAWLSTLRGGRRRSGLVIGVYYTALLVSAAALVSLAPWYGIFAFVGYVHAFLLLHGTWRYIGVVVTAMIMSVSYMGGLTNISADVWWLWGAISLVTALLAVISFYLAETADQHRRRQKQALAQLHEANVRLETALKENAGLQAQLLVQAREAGVLDERQRVARDIHDTLAQSLAGIVTQLQAAEQMMGEPPAARRHMTKAMALARESLTEARRTVHALEPEALIDARLPDAIGAIARRWSAANRIDAVLITTGEPRPMHADVEVALLRAAQEALANVAKHANADRVGLTLSYMEDLVTLDVRDDGDGFDPTAVRSQSSATGGFGLNGMRQRMQRLAGRLHIETEVGGGTAISASVPAIPSGGDR